MYNWEKKNYFDEINNLFFTTYVIGYDTDGESIIVLVHTEEPVKEIYYLGVIDSYVKNNINITIDIIRKILSDYDATNKKLDMLCWTHPHDDHTIGIVDIIKKYCNKKTLIIAPNIMYMSDNCFSEESKKVKDFIRSLNFGKSLENRYNIKFVSGNDIIQEVNFGKSPRINMLVKHFGPYDHIGFMQNPNNIDMNKLSTALMIKINDIHIFLGGDTDDMNIKAFDAFPDHINVCKIPHHTSLTSQLLIEKFNKTIKSEVACTTIFNNGKIPNKKLLVDYCNKFSEVFCTSSKIIDSKLLKENINDIEFDNDKKVSRLNDDEYGIIKIVIDVINNEYKPYIIGNAKRVEVL